MNSDMRNVYIESCESYDDVQVKHALSSIMTALQQEIPPLRNKRVLIKPNILSDAPPQKSVTTHPAVVRNLILWIREQGGIPFVGDSPAIQTSRFRGSVCGIEAVCRETGAEWLDFSDGSAAYPIPVPAGSSTQIRMKNLHMTRHLQHMDLVISAAKMKTHQLMQMTGAAKNLFGLIPGLQKSPYHLRYPTKQQFGDFITDITAAMPVPVLALIDGITAMEGPGPNNGYPKGVGVLIASSDLTAADIAAAQIMGYDPMEIATIASAFRRRRTALGSPESLLYPFLTPQETAAEDFILVREKKRAKTSIVADFVLSKIAGPFYRKRQHGPVIDPNICIACGKCAAVCPVKAIHRQQVSPERHFYAVGLASCIRCYCCHEVCPEDAIEIVRQKAQKRQNTLIHAAEIESEAESEAERR